MAKVKIGLEDLEIGDGTVVQKRGANGTEVTITKINADSLGIKLIHGTDGADGTDGVDGANAFPPDNKTIQNTTGGELEVKEFGLKITHNMSGTFGVGILAAANLTNVLELTGVNQIKQYISADKTELEIVVAAEFAVQIADDYVGLFQFKDAAENVSGYFECHALKKEDFDKNDSESPILVTITGKPLVASNTDLNAVLSSGAVDEVLTLSITEFVVSVRIDDYRTKAQVSLDIADAIASAGLVSSSAVSSLIAAAILDGDILSKQAIINLIPALQISDLNLANPNLNETGAYIDAVALAKIINKVTASFPNIVALIKQDAAIDFNDPDNNLDEGTYATPQQIAVAILAAMYTPQITELWTGVQNGAGNLALSSALSNFDFVIFEGLYGTAWWQQVVTVDFVLNTTLQIKGILQLANSDEAFFFLVTNSLIQITDIQGNASIRKIIGYK